MTSAQVQVPLDPLPSTLVLTVEGASEGQDVSPTSREPALLSRSSQPS